MMPSMRKFVWRMSRCGSSQPSWTQPGPRRLKHFPKRKEEEDDFERTGGCLRFENGGEMEITFWGMLFFNEAGRTPW